MIKTIIVDDEPIITEEMADLLSDYKEYELAGIYSEPWTVLEAAEHIKPDCAFLDIEMMGMNGIELAERLLILNQNMEIIFVTAYNHYATEAFEINAVDYLLKPVSPQRLQKSLERIEKRRTEYLKTDDHTCEVKCFGSFEVLVGERMIKWSRAKTRELFAYLIQYQGKSLSKYALCELLWPGSPQEQALSYLQTSVWTIRKKFKELGFEGLRIQYSDHRYIVSLEGVSCDTLKFEKHYRAFKRTGNVNDKELALSYYRGEYMEGEDWLWVYPDRAKYERMYMELGGR